MTIVINGSGTVTGVTNVGSAAANTAVVMNDSGSNSNTCRAWVNFNGTGTVAIRASFNVSSITDNGVGNYNVNFTNAMPDGLGATIAGWARFDGATSSGYAPISQSYSTYSRVAFQDGSGAATDAYQSNVAVFR